MKHITPTRLLATTALFLAFTPQATPARGQTVADAMSCAQAIAYFAANRMIYKIVNGKPLPIRTGTPISRARDVSCRGRGQMERRYSVRTTDNPRCVISVYCQ